MRFESYGLEQELCFWKRESKTLEECEDFAGGIPELGLFAISDGAGTTSFSGTWAQCLVEQFLSEPLLSPDGFEVERWVHQARTRFQQRIPDPESLPANLRNDLLYRGAAATFVGVQFRHAVHEPDRTPVAACFVIAMGDSCAIHYGADGQVVASHPKQSAADFDASPICFPTKGYDAAWWRGAEDREFSIREGEYIVLATDAVSRWLLVDDESLRRERFELLLGQDRISWPHFVESLRRRRLMRDDDSTAVTIRASEIVQPISGSEKLDTKIRSERRRQLENALKSKDLDRIAFEYGSGAYFENQMVKEGVKSTPLATFSLLRKSQRTIEARRTLLEALGRYMERGKRNREELQQIWFEFSDVLITAPFAEGARRTLKAEGFDLSDQPKPLNAQSDKEKLPERQEESDSDQEHALSPLWPPIPQPPKRELDELAGNLIENSEQKVSSFDHSTPAASTDDHERMTGEPACNDESHTSDDDGASELDKDAGSP